MDTKDKKRTAILPVPKRRYDVTEAKKAELDFLTDQVLDAQHEVEQYQAMVASLTEKSNEFQSNLAIAQSKRDQARANQELMDEIVQDSEDLKSNTNIALDEMSDAESKSKTVAEHMEELIKELIYSAEVINKFSNMLLRKKEQNPLISDELMTTMSTAGKDANNAVALCLVALKSSFTSYASSIESEATASLAYKEAVRLNAVMTGDYLVPDKLQPAKPVDDPKANSLQGLIKTAYEKAKTDFEEAQTAENITTQQLDMANGQLNKAQVKLASLQAGLAAATAAAYAS